MASMKARKGNPMEFNTAYSLLQSGYIVERSDMNVAGVDLVVKNKSMETLYYVECKHHKGFSWNELIKYFNKTKKHCTGSIKPMLIFRANNQPVLIMLEQGDSKVVLEYNDFFMTAWSKRPTGYKLWKNNESSEN